MKKIILMREEQNGGRLLYIEYLKGLSMLILVLFHIERCYMSSVPYTVTRMILPFSYVTRVFFFCSGFGLYYSYLRNPLPWTDFIKKRFVKVYLPYILVIFVCALVPYTYADDDRLAALLSHVFLYKMFVPKYIQSFGPYWFMSSIFQYYLLFYAIIKLKDKVNNNKRFLLIWIVISLVWSILAWCFPLIREKLDWVFDTCIFLHGWVFAWGLLTAELLHQKKVVFVTVKNLLLTTCISMVVTLIATYGTDIQYLKEIPRGVFLMCFATIAWAICGEAIQRFIVWCGSFSFEWYLTHMLILEGIFRLTNPVSLKNQLIFCGSGFIITAFAAWLYHQFVKRVLFGKIRV